MASALVKNFSSGNEQNLGRKCGYLLNTLFNACKYPSVNLPLSFITVIQQSAIQIGGLRGYLKEKIQISSHFISGLATVKLTAELNRTNHLCAILR